MAPSITRSPPPTSAGARGLVEDHLAHAEQPGHRGDSGPETACEDDASHRLNLKRAQREPRRHGRPVLDPAAAHAERPVRPRGEGRVVSHDDDRRPVGVDLLEQGRDLLARPLVELTGRLVGQK